MTCHPRSPSKRAVKLRRPFHRYRILLLQSIAHAFEHCVIRCGLRNVSYWCIFNHISRLYDLIFIKLPCEPGRKGACPDDWITQQITQCTHVQTHTQSVVANLRTGLDQWTNTLTHCTQSSPQFRQI